MPMVVGCRARGEIIAPHLFEPAFGRSRPLRAMDAANIPFKSGLRGELVVETISAGMNADDCEILEAGDTPPRTPFPAMVDEPLQRMLFRSGPKKRTTTIEKVRVTTL